MYLRTGSCYSVEDHFQNRVYYLLDERLTWREARDSCSENNDGYLAAVNNKAQFNFMLGMFDKYRAQGGHFVSAWLDGKYEPATAMWRCDAYVYGTKIRCQAAMPWAFEEPNNLDFDEHCILLWWSRTDGVVNYVCDALLPAICATHRYSFLVNRGI